MRFNIAAKLIRESTTVSPTGVEVVDARKLTSLINNLERGGNLDILYDKDKLEFLRFLPRFFEVAPPLPKGDAGASMARQELARMDQAALIPTPGGIYQMLKARRQLLTSAIWTMYANSVFTHGLGNTLENKMKASSILRAGAVGMAAHMREMDSGVRDLLNNGALTEDLPDVVDIQTNQAGEKKPLVEFNIPHF
jgi:hypothetical protein